MDAVFQLFRNTLYQHTGGLLFQPPQAPTLQLGDFFQIRGSQCLPLGSAHNLSLSQKLQVSAPLPLQEADWHWRSGIGASAMVLEGSLTESGLVQQLLQHRFKFEGTGSFIFAGIAPVFHCLINWSALEEELILCLTQNDYTFRQVAVVTQCVQLKEWGLVFAEAPGAFLQAVINSPQLNFEEWFFQESLQITASRSVRILRQKKTEPLTFFKAKQLVLHENKQEALFRELLSQSPQWAANWLKTDLANLLGSEAISPASTLQFFSWKDMSLSDWGLR